MTAGYVSLHRELRLQALQCWAYRLGGFALLNIMDDPAWLALMFC